MNSITSFQELLNRREPLCDELQGSLHKNSLDGHMIHHPLVIEPFYAEELAALCNERYRQKQEHVSKAALAQDWEHYIWLHERPYRLQAFIDAMSRGLLYPVASSVELLRQVWMDAEAPGINLRIWVKLFQMINSNLKSHLMDEEEREHLASLPAAITIWRGVRKPPEKRYGISWSLSRERATWFAKRFAANGSKPTLYNAVIPKEVVTAYLDGRNEQEVIVLHAGSYKPKVVQLGG